MTFKTRFAPSPTGLLHVGNARSAVLNWAYINSIGGKFLLRIDDTDKERSKTEFENIIKEDLKWLGITWSKTFNQSDREAIYQENIKKLKESKKLYPCFESMEELSLKRKSLLTAGKPPIYDRNSLNLTKEEINSFVNQGKKPHWRFKIEDRNIEWQDLIKGKISFESKNLSDPILIREDGSLLYHLPSVIDDIEENITDIIRGEDHISNTAFHIQIFDALNSPHPKFGHHSLLADEKGKSFGKRLGSLSIRNLRDEGFESITLLNYLISIGSSNDITKEKNISLLKNNFEISSISKSSPKFSIQVLESLNKEILQSYEFSEIKEKFKYFKINNASEMFWNFVKNNINFFSESTDWWKIIHSKEIYLRDFQDYLNLAIQLLPPEPYDDSTWEEWTKKIRSKTGKQGKELFMPLRLALTGKEKGPELKKLIPLLTREQILKKLGQ